MIPKRLTSVLYVITLICGVTENAYVLASENDPSPAIDAALKQLERITLHDLATNYVSESDPLKIGKIGALLASQCNTQDLLRLRDSPEPALAVFAEWQLTIRELDVMALRSFFNREKDRAPQSKPAWTRYGPQSGGPNRDQVARLRSFMNILETKTNVRMPIVWRDIICESMYYQNGFISTFDAFDTDAYWAFRALKRKPLEVRGEPGLTRIARDGGNEWIIRRPEGTEASNILDYETNDDWCYVTMFRDHTSQKGPEIYAYRRASLDPVWTVKCATYCDPEVVKFGSQQIHVFMVASDQDGTIVSFFLHATGFAVDVLDNKTGKRKWCIANSFPRLVNPLLLDKVNKRNQ